MADNKKKSEPLAGAALSSDDEDLLQYLPEGMDLKDLHKTGGLTPTYSPKHALDGAFPRVAGYIDRIMVLPTMAQGKDDEFTPVMILLRELVKPTKATVGRDDDRQVVDVEAGKDILIPLTGNLKNNKELINALADQSKVYFCVAKVVGQQKVNNQPSKMWVWDLRICDKSQAKPREGIYALPAANAQQLGVTATGASFDLQTGEVVKSAPAGAQPAAAS